MSLPVVTETISVDDPTSVSGLVRLFAQEGGGGLAYTNAGTPITLGGPIRVSFDALGVLKADDGTTSLTLNPNSGGSDDAIASPANTVWAYEVKFPGERAPYVRYLSVPDSAGPLNVADILDVNPTDFPDTGALPGGGAEGAVLTKLSASDRDADWVPSLDLTVLPSAVALGDTDTVVGVQGGVVVAPTMAQIATYTGAGGSIANNRIMGNVSGSAAAPAALTGAQVGALISLSDLAQPTGTYTMTKALVVGDGTASHGAINIGTSLFGPAVALFADTSHANAKLVLASTGSIAFGAGGASATDWSMARSGSATAGITGSLTISGTLGVTGVASVGNASAGGHALNRDTADARYGVADGSTVEVSSSTLRVKDNGVTLAKMATVATSSILGRVTASTGNVEVLTGAQAGGLIKVSDLAAPTGALTWSQTLNLTPSSGSALTVYNATPGNGMITQGVSAFGSAVACFANSGEANATAIMGSALGFRLGPGGGSGQDVILARTGSVAASFTGQLTIVTGLTMGDGINIAVNTSTGTKIGTATGQKIGLWNATPVIQYATTGTSTGFTAGGGTTATHLSTFTGNTGSAAYTVGDIVLCLKRAGIMAA